MKNIKISDVKREWHLIDAKDKVLGRLSSQIASLLMGKHKSMYTPYLDSGDNVVVINAGKVILTGKKENQKKYYRHSGYPGALKVKTASQVRQEKPEDLIRHAVVGMLPKKALGKIMRKKLYIFAGSEHSYENKFKN